MSDLSPGDPLAGTTDAPRHESGLPGYTSPPPPGAGGPVAPVYGEPVAGRYVLASWLSRVGAAIIDGLIIGVVALVPFLVLGAALSVGFSGDSGDVWAAFFGFILAVVCISLVALLYAPVMMARTDGKTLGRMAFNIRVVRTSGERMTFWWAFLREVVIKSFLFGIIGSATFGIASALDVLWPLWDEENRALHDFICATRVVKD
jgi:uncharacterized RDD family membrane protein YckC